MAVNARKGIFLKQVAEQMTEVGYVQYTSEQVGNSLKNVSNHPSSSFSSFHIMNGIIMAGM